MFSSPNTSKPVAALVLVAKTTGVLVQGTVAGGFWLGTPGWQRAALAAGLDLGGGCGVRQVNKVFGSQAAGMLRVVQDHLWPLLSSLCAGLGSQPGPALLAGSLPAGTPRQPGFVLQPILAGGEMHGQQLRGVAASRAGGLGPLEALSRQQGK